MLYPSERFTNAREVLARHLRCEGIRDERNVVPSRGDSLVHPREEVLVGEISSRAPEAMLRASANTA